MAELPTGAKCASGTGSFMPYERPLCQEVHSGDGLGRLFSTPSPDCQLPEGLLRPVDLTQERHWIERAILRLQAVFALLGHLFRLQDALVGRSGCIIALFDFAGKRALYFAASYRVGRSWYRGVPPHRAQPGLRRHAGPQSDHSPPFAAQSTSSSAPHALDRFSCRDDCG